MKDPQTSKQTTKPPTASFPPRKARGHKLRRTPCTRASGPPPARPPAAAASARTRPAPLPGSQSTGGAEPPPAAGRGPAAGAPRGTRGRRRRRRRGRAARPARPYLGFLQGAEAQLVHEGAPRRRPALPAAARAASPAAAAQLHGGAGQRVDAERAERARAVRGGRRSQVAAAPGGSAECGRHQRPERSPLKGGPRPPGRPRMRPARRLQRLGCAPVSASGGNGKRLGMGSGGGGVGAHPPVLLPSAHVPTLGAAPSGMPGVRPRPAA